MDRIFIGIAWPYANGPIHIGHLAGAYLPGDSFARYQRLRGREVLMVSGSDMHGTPISVKADQEGTTAEAVATRYDAVHRSSFQRLGISFDLYTHTHTVLHERTVQEIFLALLERRLLVRRTEEAPYCPKERRFLPDRYLRGTCPHCGHLEARGDECDRCGRILEPKELGAPVCRLCGAPAEFRPSEHFYLRLDLLQPKVEALLAAHPEWRASVRGVAERFLGDGLRATPITRDLAWGVPIPLDGYDGKRIYVWFEAVIGYLSASKEWAVRAGAPDDWRKFWDPAGPVRPYYFIGKDNIFHHTVLWPAICAGVGGLALPADVPANEWLTVSKGKISKSRPEDAGAFLPALLERYAPDVIRFFAAAMAPQNHDTDYTPEEFDRLTEDVLSNQYGNLVQRLLVLARDRYGGRIPPIPAPAADGAVAERIQTAHRRIAEEFERVHLKEALELALAELREANRRFHEARPWQSDEATRDRIVGETLWAVKASAVWLAPVLPFSSDEVFRMLGYPSGPRAGDWDAALVPPPAGQGLGEIRPLFPRREPARAAAPATPAPADRRPSLEALDLRSAVVRRVELHPSADRLYALSVDAGEATPRSVIAGLRPYLRPEELEGRRVLFLANLEARTIRSVASDGMLLAAQAGEKVVLLEPPEGVEPGRSIEGCTRGAPRIPYATFERSPLTVGAVRSARDDRTSVDLGTATVEVPGTYPDGAVVVVWRPSAGATEGVVLRFSEGGPVRPAGDVPPGGHVR